ncbi:MAG: rhodanese-like domain-containing protein, partial [Gammaproteobacteria bacterium]
MKTLNRDQLANLLARNGHIHLINVLSPEDFSTAHIPGSYNIPVADAGFVQKVAARITRKDADIVVYCANLDCTASPNAARRLEEAGYT